MFGFQYADCVNDLSEEISKLAEQFDPEREADAQSVRSLVQGAMYMQASLNAPTPPLRSLVKIRDVEQLVDEHGNYQPWYTIITESGHRLRVTLEVE